MDKQKENLFLLVKSAIDGVEYRIEQEDLTDVYKYAIGQGIVSLVYAGAFNCGLHLNGESETKIFEKVCLETLASEKQLYELNEIERKFQANRIDYMPLKGARLKNIYPKPEYRTMSDIDILVKIEQYPQIESIMYSLGYEFHTESDHEYIWNKGNINVELHKRIIPSYNEDYYEYFKEGWDFAKKVSDNAFKYEMSIEDEFIFIFAHLCKHYRDSGIGIRHLIDIWVYLKKYPTMNAEYVKEIMTKLKIHVFYLNVLKTLNVWFNAEKEDEITQYITDFAFGVRDVTREEAQVLSDALKKTKKGKTLKQIKRDKIKNSIFIPYKTMCTLYPFLIKAKILTPFVWVYHVIKRLFTKGRLKKYNQQFTTINENSVDEYKRSLNFVGLDYNFEKDEK